MNHDKNYIVFSTELPFWVRIADNFSLLYDDDHKLIIRNSFWKLWIKEIRFDLKTLLYMGERENFYKNSREEFKEIKKKIIENKIPYIWQRCRTVIEIIFFNKNLEKAIKEKNYYLLKNFVFQHLFPHINDFVEQYRMVSFDQMVYKISPWDIPFVSFKINEEPAYTIVTYDYLSWNKIPMIGEYGKPDTFKPFYLIPEPEKIWNNYNSFPTRHLYEIELLNAYNFKIRGDYESAIIRAVTAFEILLDSKIKNFLIKMGKTEEEAEKEIENNYIWRLKKELFYKTVGKRLEDVLSIELLKIVEDARKLRHDIVHKGRKILPSEHGMVRFFLDHLRFAINSLEDNSEYSVNRDKLLLQSNIEFVDFLDQ